MKMMIKMMTKILVLVLAAFLISQVHAFSVRSVSLSRHRREPPVPRSKLELADTCEDRYKSIHKFHSMCIKKIGKPVALSQAVKDSILKKHNDYRANVSPTATNMLRMVWNDDVARVAEGWAQTCHNGHDFDIARQVPEFPNVFFGQNFAGGHETINEAVRDWHAEVENFVYGKGSTSPNAVVGHYTQVVQSIGGVIGCGMATCPDKLMPTRIVCNYFGGNANGTNPYEAGETCAACKSKCKDKLCDCGDKFCYNWGVLDLNTCTCKCRKMFKGDQCETKDCSSVTEKTAWCYDSFFDEKDSCTKNANYPYDCPIKCGTCPPPKGQDASSPPPKDENEVAPTISDNDCGDKECVNGGELDAKCNCDCPNLYEGEKCEIKKDCSEVKDDEMCSAMAEMGKNACQDKQIVAQCPKLCRVC